MYLVQCTSYNVCRYTVRLYTVRLYTVRLYTVRMYNVRLYTVRLYVCTLYVCTVYAKSLSHSSHTDYIMCLLNKGYCRFLVVALRVCYCNLHNSIVRLTSFLLRRCKHIISNNNINNTLSIYKLNTNLS